MDAHGTPLEAASYPPGGPGGYGPPPGGYGGPPGGPPPGGFGGPPGGPPGGYGGPPPGGFGGPPPGGPPFGAPGGGYGSPPMAPMPPPRKGTNVGMIVGIGCGVLFLIASILGVIGFVVARRATQEIADTTPPTSPAPPVAPATPADDGSLKAELRDLRDFKGSIGSARHFVGEIHNTGTQEIGFPIAKVTLFDAANTAVDSGVCASVVRLLPPGEKVPCTFTTLKSTYSTFKAQITPVKSFFRGQLAKIGISETKFTPKRGFSPHTLEGKLTNESAFAAKKVTAVVSLYGKNGKIVGADQELVAGDDLAPGASGRFTAKVFNAAETPETWQVLAIGYSE